MKGVGTPPRRAVAAALALALLAPSPAAAGGGSIWSRMRRPEAERRRELAVEAQGHELKAHQMLGSRNQLDRAEIVSHLARAAVLLEEAGAATSSDLALRYRLASVYSLQDEPKKALTLLESIGRADPPAPLRAAVFADMAVAYAHLGRIDDEIKAYGESLRVQPVAHERSRLLANRAEAYMLLGDVTSAVAGYRAALALLSADYMMFGSGATTLWGLAVALDRSGDLDTGLDAVRVARSYDPQDKHLNGPGWFYLPDYDRHWYEALGHWQVARKGEVVTSVRIDAYARAVASWEEYVSAAARDDKWLPLARVRLKQCEKERAAFLGRPRASGVQGTAAPASGIGLKRLPAERPHVR
jgi:tetratricopeptide (TPR) repeat protein